MPCEKSNCVVDVVLFGAGEEAMSGNSIDAKASVGLANSLSNVFKLVSHSSRECSTPNISRVFVYCLCAVYNKPNLFVFVYYLNF